MMGGCPTWWSMSNLRRTSSDEASPLLQCPLPPSLAFSQQPHELSNYIPMSSCCEDPELPQTWSQALMGGLATQEERYSLSTPFQTKKMENLENQLIYHSQGAQVQDLKQENSEDSGYAFSHVSSSSWGPIVTVSPRSCDTSSFSRNMLNFSNKKTDRKHQLTDHFSESNSTENGGVLKKARIQGSSLSQPSTLKVRKEKLGDRITALHQLVSPFGKTDTASVLLEAFGYIRFLQSQIEALSSPYLARGSGNMRQPDGNDEQKKDLRSRGLCLVPVSCTVHVESNNGADYWASSLRGSY
ncbi:transcription factor bHLH68-like [Dendrobium catenatum]|uniref:transcription factor bHLH68-like n=1 Tax=Dendrobium catenatum TaxID=906689 RepID=UPI0009F36A72|nr:transcription factor bHLH68-like [Dendrobium catenatum]